MAPSAPTPTIDGVSTMSELASFLRQAEDITGQISFHSSLQNAVTHFVRSSEPASGEQVADMVQALDCDEPKLCTRLTATAFILVFAVLRASKSSWPKHRGLYLLANSLTDSDQHQPSTQLSSSSLDGRPLLPRKARIGKEVLGPSVKHFCNGVANDGDRRWMGVLALELLKDCKENVRLLIEQFEECQEKLGSTVIDEQHELLRYIAGSIVRQLVRSGLSVGSFWPTDIDIAAHTAFLESQVQSSQWLEIFEGYLDNLDSEIKNHNEKFAPFSRLLRLGQNTYTSPGARSPSVLVTVHGLLSIVVLENDIESGDNRAAQYIDIPLENITGVDVTRSIVDSSADSVGSHMRFMAHIELVDSENHAVYVNARAQRQPFVDLAFDDKGIADYMKTLIHIRQSQNTSFRCGTHAVLDGSQSITDSNSLTVQHLLPTQLKSMEAQNLIATAVHAEELLERQISRDTHNPLSPVLASDRVCNKPKSMLQTARISLAGSPMLASVGDVEAQFGTTIDAAHAITISNGNWLSLSQWKEGADTIETALEFVDHTLDLNAMDNTTTQLQQGHDLNDTAGGNALRDTKKGQKVPETAAMGTVNSAMVTGGSRPIPTHPSEPTAEQRLLLSKVNQRLLGRHGEPVNKLGTGNRKPDRSTSAKALAKSRSVERNNAPESPSKSGGDASHATTPDVSVYDLPSSPARVSKAQPAGKGKKKQAKSSTTKIHKTALNFEQSKKNQSLQPKTKVGSTKPNRASSSRMVVNGTDRTGEDEIVEGNEFQEESRGLRSAMGPFHRKNNPKVTKNAQASAAPTKFGVAPKSLPTSKMRIRNPPQKQAVLPQGRKRRTAAVNANQRIQVLYTKIDKGAENHLDGRANSREASYPDDTGKYKKDKTSIALEGGIRHPEEQQNSTHSEGIKANGILEIVQSHKETNGAEANQVETNASINADVDTRQPVLAAHEKSESAHESRNNCQADSAPSQSKSKTPSTPEAELFAAEESVDLVNCGLTTSRSRSPTLERRANRSEMILQANLRNQMVCLEKASTPNAISQLDLIEDTVAIPVARMAPLAAKSDVSTVQNVSLAFSQNGIQPALGISEAQNDNFATPSLKTKPMGAGMNASIKDNGQDDMSNTIHISSEEEQPSPENERQSSEEVSDVLHQEDHVHKKRKLDDVVRDSIKRVKVSTPKPTKGTASVENADNVITDDYTQRKATIIGFSVKGPRNQGVLLSNRVRGTILPQQSSNKAHKTPGLSTKRKRVDVQEITRSTSPQRLAKTPGDKRRRTVNVVPPTREADQPAFTRITSPCLPSVSQKLSSQGTRVQDNGSPIATADQVRRVTNVNMDGLLRRLTDDWEFEFPANEYKEEETNDDSIPGSLSKRDMELPPIRPGSSLDVSAAGRRQYMKRSSSNMKLQPSSPTAPSRMLEDLAAHKIQSDGQFLNLHTATIVRTTIPQDPFMAKGQNSQTSFMQMLRASVPTNKEKQVRTEKEAETASRLFVDFASHHVDPDKTLVEKGRLRHPQQPSSSPGNSSSPPRSGAKRSPFASDSDKGKEREQLAEVWRNALREHHKGTLGSLYDMSNRLIKHLLDKEAAIEDTVADYATGGARLVESLSGAQRESHRNSSAKIDNAKQTLTKSFGILEKHLSNKLKETKTQQVKELQKTWLEEQQKIRSHLESAMMTWGQ